MLEKMLEDKKHTVTQLGSKQTAGKALGLPFTTHVRYISLEGHIGVNRNGQKLVVRRFLDLNSILELHTI